MMTNKKRLKRTEGKPRLSKVPLHKNPVINIYNDEKILFYLRTHPIWYKILSRYPERYNEFVKLAKEELKLTTYHKLDRWKNQASLIGLLTEYMTSNK